jgi:phosphoribosylaminoimidazole-succinocarboxamide synthase
MTTATIGPLLHEGKAKKVFATDRPDVVAIEYKDDATAFNARKKATLPGKGAMNCRIAALLFEHLEERSVTSHYLGLAGENLMLARRLTIVPLEVVVRNIAAGSLCRQTPIEAGTVLEPPLLDLYYKDDALGDPLLSEARLDRLGMLSGDQLQRIRSLALEVNRILAALFASIHLELVDFKIEIGIDREGALILADEISPDTCRLWDMGQDDAEARILDKDRFRRDLGGVTDAYGEVLKRVQGVCPEPRICR